MKTLILSTAFLSLVSAPVVAEAVVQAPVTALEIAQAANACPGQQISLSQSAPSVWAPSG